LSERLRHSADGSCHSARLPHLVTSDDKTDTNTGGDSPTTVPGVSKGLGSQGATADVVSVTLVPPDTLKVSYVEVVVKNTSSKRSNYIIEAAVESADGSTKVDDTLVTVLNLEPGQTTTEKGIVRKPVPSGSKVTLKTVSRTASS
jgi:hypothetical protein